MRVIDYGVAGRIKKRKQEQRVETSIDEETPEARTDKTPIG